MGDVYYLRRNEDGMKYVYGIFEVEKSDSHAVFGKCYSCHSWDMDGMCYEPYFHADVYCKRDSCTHWRFYGEDYDGSDKDECDPYYHICGEECLVDHVRLMCFVWKLVADIMGSGEYFTNEKTKKLVDMMLDGYYIERVIKEV